MRGQIPPRVVLMYKRPVDRGHRLQHVLQRLSQIMTVPQGRVLIEHDVNLHVELVPGMVGLETLDLLDGLCKSHGEVQQHVSLVGRCSCPGKVFDMPRRGPRPVENDKKREQQTAKGIEPPEFCIEPNLIAVSTGRRWTGDILTERKYNTKNVENNICHCVL